MRKIVVNGRFLLRRVTGVERYAREILAELDRIIQPGEVEVAIPKAVTDIPKFNNIRVVKIGRLPNRVWEHISFPIYVAKQKGIALSLCNVAPLLSPGIVAIFDMKIREHPEFYSKKFVLWYRILFANQTKWAKLIFTDSFSAKADILRYYHISEEKIVVAPCAWQHFQRIDYDESTLDKYSLKKGEYYFAMGSLDPNKNFKWIAETARMNKNHLFVVAGSINENVFAESLGFETPKNMTLLGYISDREAKTLMRDCKAFLFPSICEGFGMPPMEALSAGAKAVIVSDIPVMHELFGNEFVYVDPNIPCKEIIVHDVDEEVKNRILNKYSWKNTAEIVYKKCKSVLK